MQEFLSVIRSSTLFSGISEQELTTMLACLGTKASRFPKDALLLRAGDTAESIGLVLSGSVLVEQEDVWGNRNILSDQCLFPVQFRGTQSAHAHTAGQPMPRCRYYP